METEHTIATDVVKSEIWPVLVAMRCFPAPFVEQSIDKAARNRQNHFYQAFEGGDVF